MAVVWTNKTASPGDDLDVAIGDRLDVVGWVFHGSTLYAVWRDDRGDVQMVPAWALRLQPAVETTPTDHASQHHHAVEYDCGDPSCGLNWRRSA